MGNGQGRTMKSDGNYLIFTIFLDEAKALAEKMEREKKQLQEYVEKDAR